MQISDPTLLENLDMRQRQTLVSRELALWRGEEARNGHYIAVRVGGVRCVIWFGYGVRGADAYIDVLCLGSHCGTRENRCAQSRKNECPSEELLTGS